MQRIRRHRPLVAALTLLLLTAAPAVAGPVSTIGGLIAEYEATFPDDIDGALQAKAALNCLALAIALLTPTAESATETWRTKCRAWEDGNLIDDPVAALAKGMLHFLGFFSSASAAYFGVY